MSSSLDYASLESSSKYKSLPPPPSFSRLSSKHLPAADSKTNTKDTERYNQLKSSKAWDTAISPAKSLPMQAFMLYMSGGGVQIFSIGIVVMLLLQPLRNLAAMNTAFSQFAPTPSNTPPTSLLTLPLQKVVYLLCNLLTLGVGLWKCKSMGLLPVGKGDWLAFETRGPTPEYVLT